MLKKTLFIDCDGVLYPGTQLGLKEILAAMKDVYREKLRLTGCEQREISAKTLKENHLGAFNYIKEMCNYKKYDFSLFSQQMADKVDYTHIKPNPLLWQQLLRTAKICNIAILSNNSRPHIEKVLYNLFKKNAAAAEAEGLKICDITFTEENGYFLPKQSDRGLSFVAKKLNLTPADCTLVDDSVINLQSARRQGMHGVLVNQEKTLEKYLQNLQTSTLNFSSKIYG